MTRPPDDRAAHDAFRDAVDPADAAPEQSHGGDDRADASGLPPDAATTDVEAGATAPGAPPPGGRADASGLPPDAPAEDVDGAGVPPTGAHTSRGVPPSGADTSTDSHRAGDETPRSVRAPRALAAALVALLVALATANAIALVSDLWAHPTFRQAATGETPFLDAGDVQEWQSAVGVAQVSLTIVVAAAWLVWFRRAYSTAGALHGGTRRAPSWAVWAWLVPVVNLFRPKAMTDEAFAGGGDGVPAHVHWWWGVTLASVALSVAALVATPASPSAADLADATLLHALADLAGTAAALLGVAVVTSLTARLTGAARARATA
ncbi:MAG TPA: DUF4328 domain-containing protein [Actinomycetota bacterium]|nr:DUF4328 domain-containing protein [Actinomycetota bacterium]